MKLFFAFLIFALAAFGQQEVESRNRINLLTGSGTFRFAVIPVTGNYAVSGADVAGMNLTNIVFAVDTTAGSFNFQLPATFPNVFSVLNVGTNYVNIIPSPGQTIVIAPSDGTIAYANGLTNRFALKVHTLFQLNSTNVFVQSEFKPLPNVINLVTNNISLLKNPNVATQILAGVNVTVTSNNAGIYTITGSGGGGGGGWSGSYAAASNAVFKSGSTNHTNVVIEQSVGQFVPLWAVRGSNGTLLKSIDRFGYNIWTNLPKPNYRPPTNNLSFGVGKFARLLPSFTDPESNSFPVQPFTHRRVEISPATSTRLSAWGTSPVSNVAATVSHPGANEFLPDMFQIASGAGSNASASIASERAIAFSGTRAGANGWFFSAEWASTNGVIHFGGGGVGQFIGMSDIAAASQTNMSASTNLASTRYAGFAVHGQLGAGATNWHFICKDNAGGNEFRIDTTLPLLASNLYRGWIHCPPQGRTMAVRLDNLTANTTTSFHASTSVPTNGLRMLATISNRTNIIHSLRVSRMYLEAPTAP